jgi:hypothetical protein
MESTRAKKNQERQRRPRSVSNRIGLELILLVEQVSNRGTFRPIIFCIPLLLLAVE